MNNIAIHSNLIKTSASLIAHFREGIKYLFNQYFYININENKSQVLTKH